MRSVAKPWLSLAVVGLFMAGLAAPAALRAAAPSKGVELPPDLRADETSAESIVLYTAMMQEIRRAERRNDLQDLSDLGLAVGVLRELHPKQTSHLQSTLSTSVAAVQQRRLAGALVINTKKIRGPIRRVAGPAELQPGETGAFAVLLERPATKALTIELVASELSGVPATLTINKGEAAASFKATRNAKPSQKLPHLIGKADDIEEVWALADEAEPGDSGKPDAQ
ncbi:MAG: hypothetical protein KDA41_05220 [Planctomycetales bacterium]|nr:hypothetical protein [Planctomycetales bacterium]